MHFQWSFQDEICINLKILHLILLLWIMSLASLGSQVDLQQYPNAISAYGGMSTYEVRQKSKT